MPGDKKILKSGINRSGKYDIEWMSNVKKKIGLS